MEAIDGIGRLEQWWERRTLRRCSSQNHVGIARTGSSPRGRRDPAGLLLGEEGIRRDLLLGEEGNWRELLGGDRDAGSGGPQRRREEIQRLELGGGGRSRATREARGRHGGLRWLEWHAAGSGDPWDAVSRSSGSGSKQSFTRRKELEKHSFLCYARGHGKRSGGGAATVKPYL